MKKVLIIENDKKIRNIYTELLTIWGWQVFEAKDIWQAADIIRWQSLDLVVLDIHLPNIDGSDFVDIIKEYHPHIRIFVSSVEPLERQKILIPDADVYFDKSEGADVFFAKLNSLLPSILAHTLTAMYPKGDKDEEIYET